MRPSAASSVLALSRRALTHAEAAPAVSSSPSSSSALQQRRQLNLAGFPLAPERIENASRKKLVILGSGWSGYEILRSVDRSAWDVTIISPNTYFAFTPLLASTAVGTIEFRAALEPVRRFGDTSTFHQAWCDEIDFKEKKLICMPAVPFTNVSRGVEDSPSHGHISERSYPGTRPFEVSYDKLAISVGAYAQTFGVPGVKEYGNFLKDVKDARRIRSRILQCFEQASHPTVTEKERRNLLRFICVGGGPTGVEFAAELHDLLVSDIRSKYRDLLSLVSVQVYDVAPRVLSAFDANLVDYALSKFKREGVQIKTSHHVTEVREGELVCKEEGVVPFGLLVWSTGLAPNPLMQAIKGLKQEPKTQNLLVNDRLQTFWEDSEELNEDVLALGDCATLVSGKLPATAQVASQQAKYVAKALNREAQQRSPSKPFKFFNMGVMAYIGDSSALYDRSSAKDGLRPSWGGRLSYLLWRSAYWFRALSLRNQLMLSFYWTQTFLFGRDLTRF